MTTFLKDPMPFWTTPSIGRSDRLATKSRRASGSLAILHSNRQTTRTPQRGPPSGSRAA